jgi:hypothetical protein
MGGLAARGAFWHGAIPVAVIKKSTQICRYNSIVSPWGVGILVRPSIVRNKHWNVNINHILDTDFLIQTPS